MPDQAQKAKAIKTDPETYEGSPIPSAFTPPGSPAPYYDFAGIVGRGITQCMKDRRALQEVEKVIHGWILCATPEEIKEARLQIETGKLVMESLFITFRQMSGQ